jgi:hypothetical protein
LYGKNTSKKYGKESDKTFQAKKLIFESCLHKILFIFSLKIHRLTGLYIFVNFHMSKTFNILKMAIFKKLLALVALFAVSATVSQAEDKKKNL